MRVGLSLVVHCDAKETRSAKRFASRFDFLDLPTKRLLAVVDAADHLEFRSMHFSVRDPRGNLG